MEQEFKPIQCVFISGRTLRLSGNSCSFLFSCHLCAPETFDAGCDPPVLFVSDAGVVANWQSFLKNSAMISKVFLGKTACPRSSPSSAGIAIAGHASSVFSHSAGEVTRRRLEHCLVPGGEEKLEEEKHLGRRSRQQQQRAPIKAVARGGTAVHFLL